MNDLRLDLWNFFDGLKNWQLDLVRQLLHEPSLNEENLNDAISMLLSISGLKGTPARAPIPITKDQFLGTQSSLAEAPSVMRLYDLENVSAIEKGQALEFTCSGMTIVFGNNAAGKSSYARILKQACRTVDEKVRILPNIYTANSTAGAGGSAKIDIQRGAQSVETISRAVNTPPEAQLRSVSIFDSKCGSIYLTNENDVAYLPNDLIVLQRLVAQQDKMKLNLQEKAKSLKSKLPAFGEFVQETTTKQKLRDLSYASNHTEFEALAKLSPEEDQLLAKLEAEEIEITRTDPSKAIAQIKKQISELEGLVTLVRLVRSGLSAAPQEQIEELISNLNAAKQLNASVRSSAFTQEPLAGVGSQNWKTLWSAAREFFCNEAYPNSSFPPDAAKDERCPLCQQTISAETSERLQRFEKFVNDKSESQLREAVRKLSQAVSAVADIPIEKIEQHALGSVLKNESPTTWTAIERFCGLAKKRKAELTELPNGGDPSKTAELSDNPESVIQQLVSETASLLREKEQLLKPERLSQVQKEIAELRARQLLASRLSDIASAIDNYKSIQAMDAAIKSLSTTTMTVKMSEFTDKAVTAELSKCLELEMEALNCNDIPVTVGSRGEKGRTKCKISLKSVSPADLAEILSQGEQRALSLAFFLAEVASSQDKGPIILDDPVSSLDHLRRNYVAERLARESAKRQVIVFTHDIVFLLDLQSAAERAGTPCSTVSVRKVGKTSGIANKSLPWIAQNCKDRKGYLKNELVQLGVLERKGTDPDKLDREMRVWYELLREAWERSIEERLLAGVVVRFRYGIETQRLRNLKVTDDKIKLINEGMTATSPRVHDEGTGMNRGTATVAQAEADLKKYEDFLTLCPA